jgi:hypothetical protein
MDRMMTRKQIPVGEKVGLWLTAGERKVILDLMCLDDECEKVVRETPPGRPIAFTLDEWDLFGGYVAAEANHTDDKRLQKKLDAIFEKTQEVLNTHTDEGPEPKVFDPSSVDDPDDSSEDPFLMGLAAQLRDSQAKRLGQVQTQRLKLTKPQRDALLAHGHLRAPLRDRLAVDSSGPRTFDFDMVDLMALALAVQTAAKATTGRTRKTLVGAATQIAACFTALTRTMAGRGEPKSKASKTRKGSHGQHQGGQE